MKIKQPTYTTLIEEFLRSTDDMHTYNHLLDHLTSITGNATMSHVSAACYHLKKHGVVDFIVGSGDRGTVWWYALPKDNDDRSRVIDERAPETKPRSRKNKVTIIIHMHDDGEQA